MAEEIVEFDSDLQLATEAAAQALREFAAAGEEAKVYSVALSGGRIAKQLFEQMAVQGRGMRRQLAQVEFFWADERCVPPDDAESNFRLAWEHLLKPLRVGAERIHRIGGELEPTAAAREAEAELRRIISDTIDRQPVLDLVLLGMGEDGHVASLFPADMEGLTSPAVYRAVIGPKPPPQRVTLGYAPLKVARQVWVVASGVGKEEALQRSLSGERNTPLGRLLALREQTRILTDIPLGR